VLFSTLKTQLRFINDRQTPLIDNERAFQQSAAVFASEFFLHGVLSQRIYSRDFFHRFEMIKGFISATFTEEKS